MNNSTQLDKNIFRIPSHTFMIVKSKCNWSDVNNVYAFVFDKHVNMSQHLEYVKSIIIEDGVQGDAKVYFHNVYGKTLSTEEAQAISTELIDAIRLNDAEKHYNPIVTTLRQLMDIN